jgi:hypothetical protein
MFDSGSVQIYVVSVSCYVSGSVQIYAFSVAFYGSGSVPIYVLSVACYGSGSVLICTLSVVGGVSLRVAGVSSMLFTCCLEYPIGSASMRDTPFGVPLKAAVATSMLLARLSAGSTAARIASLERLVFEVYRIYKV